MTFTELAEKWLDISETADPEYFALLEELMEDINGCDKSKSDR